MRETIMVMDWLEAHLSSCAGRLA